VSFPDLGRMVLATTVAHRLGDRATYFDIPAAVDMIVARGFVDLDEIDPLVLDEILDQNRRAV
jgi:hypothetical protein